MVVGEYRIVGIIVLLAVLLVLIVEISGSEDGLEVQTPYGTYRGHVIKSRGGRDLLSFKGIPYAQPPVGPLRFKEPVQLVKKQGVYASNQEKECLQINISLLSLLSKSSLRYRGSEDCLYLNIFRPRKRTSQKLPVFVWIHGGAYSTGGGTEMWNGPRYFLDGNRDLIMVFINYRLGIFGFLSVNDYNLPGNLGMKDQVMALKWVKENIEFFGGDSESVTIAGESAGGASVSLHMNSKASKGLFHRAISQSGTADCSWARKSLKEARKMGSKLISLLGCPTEPNGMLTCLQNLSALTLVDSLDNLKVNKTGSIINLTPVVENDSPSAFLTEESLQNGSTVPWLTGVNSEEGLFIFQFLALSDEGYLDLSTLRNNYKKLLPLIAYYDHRKDDAITKEIIDFYFGYKGFSYATAKYLTQILSDRMFNHGLHLSARKHKGKLYMYKLSYKGSTSLSVYRPEGLGNGVGHADDLFLFFNLAVYKQLRGKDLQYSRKLLGMWYNFIVYSDPTPDDHLWKESKGGKKYLDITKDGLIMSSNMFQKRMNFLDYLEKKYKLQPDL